LTQKSRNFGTMDAEKQSKKVAITPSYQMKK